MAIATPCQTPSAFFHTYLKPESITINVDLPFPLNLDAEGAELLEANIHNAMELVLARYFRQE